MCEIGFYQPEFGQTHCLLCPSGTTTKNRGTKSINDCLPFYKIETNICESESCLNGGKCVQEEDSFSCECPDYYVGNYLIFLYIIHNLQVSILLKNNLKYVL